MTANDWRACMVGAVSLLTGCETDSLRSAFLGDREAFCRQTYREDERHLAQHERLLARVQAMSNGELERRADAIGYLTLKVPKSSRPDDEDALPYYVAYELGRRRTQKAGFAHATLPDDKYWSKEDAEYFGTGDLLEYSIEYKLRTIPLGQPGAQNPYYCSSYLTELAKAEYEVWKCKALPSTAEAVQSCFNNIAAFRKLRAAQENAQ